MTTPVGFIPSPLDHATPLQGQQMQPARAAGSAAANQPPLNGPSGYPQVPSWAQAGAGASARQANSPVAPGSVPANANGAGGTPQAVYRGPQLHTNGRGEPLMNLTRRFTPVVQAVQTCSSSVACSGCYNVLDSLRRLCAEVACCMRVCTDVHCVVQRLALPQQRQAVASCQPRLSWWRPMQT